MLYAFAIAVSAVSWQYPGPPEPPLYEFTELTGFTVNNIAWAISDVTAGGPVVVGQSFSAFTPPTLSHRAVVWRPEVSVSAVDLQTIAQAGNSSVNRASDVSPSGQFIVGYNNTAPIRGRRWTFDPISGTVTLTEMLDALPGDGGAEGVGVNSAGTAAGYSTTPIGDQRPCYWPGGSTIAVALATPPGSAALRITREISEAPAEIIVGRNDMGSIPTTRAILWKKTGATYGPGELLELLTPGQSTDAFGVSPDGLTALGFASTATQGHGVSWDTATNEVTDLGTFGATPFNMVYDMNNAGVAVGHTQFSLTLPRATLYWNGQVYNLNDRVVNNPAIGSTLFLHVATGINSTGQIAGKFGDFAIEDPYTPLGSRAFILTPVRDNLPGDINQDGSVNLADYALFAACLTGPGIDSIPAGCDPELFDRIDLNADADVDIADFAQFQTLFTG